MSDSSTVVLLGTVHNDPEGFARCLRSLRLLEPDLILVELSPFARAYREYHGPALQTILANNLRAAALRCRLPLRDALTHPEIKALRRQISLPFEYRAARRFSKLSGIDLILVDHSPSSLKLITLWPELIATDNLASLLRLPRDSRTHVSRIYDFAAGCIRAGIAALPAPLPEMNQGDPGGFWEERERFLADAVRSLVQRRRPSRAVYLGGWRHLCTGKLFPSLRDLLQVDISQCILLDRGFLWPT